MKKKSMAIAAALCALAVTVAGCGGGNGGNSGASATASPGGEAPKKDVTITVGAAQNWVKDIDRTLADKFTAKTGIKVDFQVNPDDQYQNIIKTKLATKEAPDIFYLLSGIGLTAYQPEKNFLDLSGEPWAARLTDWAREGSSIGGKLYALNMWSVDGWQILYNTEIFKKYNLTPPKNFAEFTALCQTLLNNGIQPIYENAKDIWHMHLWLNDLSVAMEKANPGIFEKLNRNEAKLADQQVLVQGLEDYKTLNDRGFFGKNALSVEWLPGYEAMATGKAAMILAYTTYQNEVADQFPDSKADQWEMFPVPIADNDAFAHSAGGIVRIVNAETKHADEVKMYFNFLAEEQNVRDYYAERKDLGETSFKGIEVSPLPKALTSVKANSPGGAGLTVQDSMTYWDENVIGKAVQDLLLGAATPKEVLQKIDDHRAKTFAAVQ